MTLEDRIDAALGPRPNDDGARVMWALCALSLLNLCRRIDERVDATLQAAATDRSLAEHARRSLGQRARWIAHDFNHLEFRWALARS